MQKGFGLIYILIGVLILGGLIGGAFYLGRQSITPQIQNSPVNSQVVQPTPSPVIDETAKGRT